MCKYIVFVVCAFSYVVTIYAAEGGYYHNMLDDEWSSIGASRDNLEKIRNEIRTIIDEKEKKARVTVGIIGFMAHKGKSGPSEQLVEVYNDIYAYSQLLNRISSALNSESFAQKWAFVTGDDKEIEVACYASYTLAEADLLFKNIPTLDKQYRSSSKHFTFPSQYESDQQLIKEIKECNRPGAVCEEIALCLYSKYIPRDIITCFMRYLYEEQKYKFKYSGKEVFAPKSLDYPSIPHTLMPRHYHWMGDERGKRRAFCASYNIHGTALELHRYCYIYRYDYERQDKSQEKKWVSKKMWVSKTISFPEDLGCKIASDLNVYSFKKIVSPTSFISFFLNRNQEVWVQLYNGKSYEWFKLSFGNVDNIAVEKLPNVDGFCVALITTAETGKLLSWNYFSDDIEVFRGQCQSFHGAQLTSNSIDIIGESVDLMQLHMHRETVFMVYKDKNRKQITHEFMGEDNEVVKQYVLAIPNWIWGR